MRKGLLVMALLLTVALVLTLVACDGVVTVRNENGATITESDPDASQGSNSGVSGEPGGSDNTDTSSGDHGSADDNVITDALGLVYTKSDDGTYQVGGYNGTDEKVFIPDNYNGVSVTSIGDRAFYGCFTLSSITIPSSVTSIGPLAFCDCYKLVEIYNQSSLRITIGSTDNGYVGYYAKNVYTTAGGSKLSTNEDGYILYTDGDTVSLIGYVGSETELILPYGITEINQGTFYKCTSLTSITIPEGVTTISDYAFYDCTKLTSITIPDSVTSIGWDVFRGCAALTYNEFDNALYLGNESNPYVALIKATSTSITGCTINDKTNAVGGSAFSFCSGLTSITIPDSVTSIGSLAFSYCSGLTSITIPDSVTSIGSSAFSGCSSLTSITIPSSVTSIGEGAFSDCTAVIKWGESPTISTIGSYAFSGYNGTAITIPDTVTSLGEKAFYSCSQLTSVTIPSSVTSIGSKAFFYCSGLTSITIPEGVTTISDYAFYKCTSLTSITIPNSVTSIGSGAFDYCSGLTSITIGSGVTSIGSEAFSYCSALTSINVQEGNTQYHSSGDCLIDTTNNQLILGCKNSVIPSDGSVTSIGILAFGGCTGLTSITIPDSVTNIEVGAFYYCSALTSINVQEGNTQYHSAGDCLIDTTNNQLILGCRNSIIPSDGSVTSIGEGAFGKCKSLTSITIPDSVTSIGRGAFFGCSSLTSVTIGSGVTSIGEMAFYGCMSLTSITFQGAKAQWEAIDKEGMYDSSWDYGTGAYTVHCTDGDIAK